MRIQIVANNPRDIQSDISRLIGKIYEAVNYEKASGEVSINSPSFGGTIVLNRGEWKRVSKRRA